MRIDVLQSGKGDDREGRQMTERRHGVMKFGRETKGRSKCVMKAPFHDSVSQSLARDYQLTVAADQAARTLEIALCLYRGWPPLGAVTPGLPS